jgi:small neutral amino acid transporter SnatA (MarC family)
MLVIEKVFGFLLAALAVELIPAQLPLLISDL